jgi:glutamate formiminotransferase
VRDLGVVPGIRGASDTLSEMGINLAICNLMSMARILKSVRLQSGGFGRL